MDYLPARRLLLLLAAASPVFVVSAPAALAVDALILLAALVDARRAAAEESLEIERRAPARIPLGGEAEIELRLHSRLPRDLAVRITDDVPSALVRDVEAMWEVRVPARRSAERRYRVRAEARGRPVLGDVHVRVLGPLGLVWHQRRHHRRDPVQVQPGLGDVRRHRLRALSGRPNQTERRTPRRRGEGLEFDSLRDYARGDDRRRIDWKATARRGAVTVRQYREERSQNLMIAIDAGRLMTERFGRRERIDHALSAALLLADIGTLHGDRVGLMVFSDRVDQYLPPTRAPLSRIADALARADARTVEPDYPGAFAHLGRQLRRRSLLVLFTDVIDPATSAPLLAHLRAAARRHLTLAVAIRNPSLEAVTAGPVDDDAETFRRAAAEELLQARTHVLANMRRAGILVADTRPEDATPDVVNRYLEIKTRRRI